MSTALFVTVADVVTRMQINEDLDGVSDVVKSALSGAHLHIEACLESELEKRAWDCTYYLDKDAYSGMQPGGVFRVQIPAYFIRQDTPVTITWAADWTMANAQSVDSALIKIDYEKGQILIDAKAYGDKYVRVQCTTGFDPDAILVAANPTADPPVQEARGPEPIPDWLNEAILSYVGVIMDTSQTTKRSDTAEKQYKKAADHALIVLAPKLRKRGFVFRPVSA